MDWPSKLLNRLAKQAHRITRNAASSTMAASGKLHRSCVDCYGRRLRAECVDQIVSLLPLCKGCFLRIAAVDSEPRRSAWSVINPRSVRRSAPSPKETFRPYGKGGWRIFAAVARTSLHDRESSRSQPNQIADAPHSLIGHCTNGSSLKGRDLCEVRPRHILAGIRTGNSLIS